MLVSFFRMLVNRPDLHFRRNTLRNSTRMSPKPHPARNARNQKTHWGTSTVIGSASDHHLWPIHYRHIPRLSRDSVSIPRLRPPRFHSQRVPSNRFSGEYIFPGPTPHLGSHLRIFPRQKFSQGERKVGPIIPVFRGKEITQNPTQMLGIFRNFGPEKISFRIRVFWWLWGRGWRGTRPAESLPLQGGAPGARRGGRSRGEGPARRGGSDGLGRQRGRRGHTVHSVNSVNRSAHTMNTLGMADTSSVEPCLDSRSNARVLADAAVPFPHRIPHRHRSRSQARRWSALRGHETPWQGARPAAPSFRRASSARCGAPACR